MLLLQEKGFLSRERNQILDIGPQNVYFARSRQIRPFVVNQGSSRIEDAAAFSVVVRLDRRTLGAIKYPANFTYVSMINLFCDQSGCKTDIGGGDPAQNIVAWDYGHLTPLAARYAVDNAVGPAILRALATQGLVKSDSGASTKTK